MNSSDQEAEDKNVEKEAPEKAGSEKASSGKAGSGTSRPEAAKRETGGKGGKGTPPPSGPKPAPARSGSGGFFSHLLSSLIGAVLAIFGLTYAHNQNLMPEGFQLGAGPAVKQHMSGTQDRLKQLEAQVAPKGAQGLDARLGALAARLEKAENNLGDSTQNNTALTQKISAMETMLAELEKAGRSGKGGGLAGLAAVTKQLKTSNRQSGELKNELLKLRTEQSGFREALAAVRNKQADIYAGSAALADDLAKLKNRTAEIKAQASRPPDVSAQINPVMATLSQLTGKIDGVINRENTARAEGRDIALALSLGELKRAVNEGNPYKPELARVLPHAPKSLDLAVLNDNAEHGLTTGKALQQQFGTISGKALMSENTAASGSFMDQVVANARSMVRVRPTGLVKGETTGAVLSRMQFKLERGDLAGSVKEGEALKGSPKEVMKDWISQARARSEGDQLLRQLEDKIRNALAGASTN